MKTFLDWAKEEAPEVLELVNAQDTVEKDDVKDATSEQRFRTGWSGNYPPAYVSGQYPQKYANPRKATADLDAENMKKNKKS